MNDRLHISNSKRQYRYYKRPNLRSPHEVRNQTFPEAKAHQIKGDIRLGYIHNTDLIFGLLKSEITRHVAIYGASGSGKSNALRVLQFEFIKQDIPFLAFDTSKRSNRLLKHLLDDLIILRWDKDFFINPFEPPPNVNLREWLLSFVEITVELFGLRTASKLYLVEFLINQLFSEENYSKESDFKTLHDFNRRLELRLKERIPINERGYINAIHGKIKAVCVALGEMVNVHKGIPIEDLLKYPVCIELTGIKSSEIQYWLISIIMAAIVSYRETLPMAFNSLRHAVFIDEASSIVGRGEI